MRRNNYLGTRSGDWQENRQQQQTIEHAERDEQHQDDEEIPAT